MDGCPDSASQLVALSMTEDQCLPGSRRPGAGRLRTCRPALLPLSKWRAGDLGCTVLGPGAGWTGQVSIVSSGDAFAALLSKQTAEVETRVANADTSECTRIIFPVSITERADRRELTVDNSGA